MTTGRMTDREMRRIGFPWSPELVERSRRSVGATLLAAQAALLNGLAANLGGGTHHAYPDHGEGYCVFNDVAVAIRHLQQSGGIRRALVIDLDVHQGNGTAAIFSGDPSVYTFSVHGLKNFPFHKETGSLDIALPDGSEDPVYLAAVRSGLIQSVRQARPDLAFYIAGADPFIGDRLGRMAVSMAGLAERDRLVFSALQQAGLPGVLVMGGGYGRVIAETVAIHLQTLHMAATFHNPPRM
jgi:acetoin utilization deacetylase AcuC-like enzyme